MYIQSDQNFLLQGDFVNPITIFMSLGQIVAMNA
jgi:hypothetical protein